MKNRKLQLSGIFVSLLLLFTACGQKEAREKVAQLPPIFPDYVDVTIPKNIAPLNFEIKDAKAIQAVFAVNGKEVLRAKGKHYVDIPQKEWHELLSLHSGKDLTVTVSAWTAEHPDGATYQPFTIHIASTDIDSYTTYRLIPPGYEEWNKMGIFQRNLTNFDEQPIMLNSQNNNGCVNCHSFCKGNPERLMFHARGKGGGTVVWKDGHLAKVDLTAMGPNKSGTYPYWHPSGRYIVYSSNQTRQSFYSHCLDKIEVYDLSSDIIIYDTERQDVLADERFSDSINWETFPTFSPDGKYLYFCTAIAKRMPPETSKLRYSLVRVPFNEANGSLGEPVDTIYSAYGQGGSVSLPRVSPDGRYLLVTLADCATFHIQHKEADLQLIDLQTGELVDTKNANSDETDSYHSWSQNGHWIAFASRRIDGRYTRLFIASFENGKFGKPFLLPQKDPEQNSELLYSYNVPELVTGKINLPKDKLASLFKIE